MSASRLRPRSLMKFCAALANPRYWLALLHGAVPAIEHRAVLEALRPRTLIDIGANRGQFSLLATRMFQTITVFAFEPLSRPFGKYRKIFSADDRVVAFQSAIGQFSGDVKIHVADRDDSSSLFEFDRQTDIFGTHAADTQRVRLNKLSHFVSPKMLISPVLMKIDVQGYELEVLKGSIDLLSFINQIYVECSYIHLYSGQPLVGDVIAFLADHGFELAGVFNQHVHCGREPVQADFLFKKTEGHISSNSHDRGPTNRSNA